jgi:hypothetical protein
VKRLLLVYFALGALAGCGHIPKANPEGVPPPWPANPSPVRTHPLPPSEEAPPPKKPITPPLKPDLLPPPTPPRT